MAYSIKETISVLTETVQWIQLAVNSITNNSAKCCHQLMIAIIRLCLEKVISSAGDSLYVLNIVNNNDITIQHNVKNSIRTAVLEHKGKDLLLSPTTVLKS